MASNAAPNAGWEFDRFELIPEKRLLLSDGEVVPLTSKALDTFVFLVANRERVVTKDELLREIWPDVIVEEGNLTQQIFLIRKALGESAQQPRYIVTVPGHGYRFTAPVREIVPRPERVRPRPGRIHPALFVAACAAILALVFFKWIAPPGRRASLDSANVRMTKVTETGKATSATVSRDGRVIAYAENDGDEYGIVVQNVATGGKAQVVAREPRMLGSLTFGPDGQFLYFTRGVLNKGGFVLYRVPSMGGDEVPVLNDVDTAVSFSPDGRQFVFMRGAGPVTQHIVIANADGSQERIVATSNPPLRFWYSSPAWSPDGRFIAAAAGKGPPHHPSSIVLIPLDGGASRDIYTTDQRIGGVRWLADGSGLLTVITDTRTRQFGIRLTPILPWSGGSVFRISYPQGIAERMTPDLADYHLCCVDVTADGERAVGVLQSLISDLWIASADQPGAVRQITWDTPIVSRHSWLPDNDTIVYRDVAGRLNAVRRNGSGFRLPVPDGLKAVGDVSACGDGRFVVFAAVPGNNIWRVTPSGGAALQLTKGPAESGPACSTDGQWVFYSSLMRDVPSLWRTSIDGGEPTLLAESEDGTFEGLPSPRGGMIFYPAFEWDNQPPRSRRMRWIIISASDRRRMYTLDAPEGPSGIPRVPPVWAPDESGIDYVVTRSGVSNIWRLPLDGGRARQMTTFDSGKIFTFAWSRDGKWLSVGRGLNRGDVALISREK